MALPPAAFAAALLTALVGEAEATYNHIRHGPPANCAATSAFNATALGLTVDTSSDVYTCDGHICWETHPGFDTGDVAWMLFATTFVMLQTPATGFAQGGLVRRKNALSVIGQSFVGVVIGCIMWYIWGYSLTFGPDVGNGFIGDPAEYAWFENVDAYDCLSGQTIPHLLFAAFQMTFALMVPVLITGAWAEKFHFFSACIFMIIWPVLVYYPTAHWIWGGGWLAVNPDDPDESRAVDYAGGVVIHTSAGVASLVVAVMLQKRRAFKVGSDEYTSNLPLTMVGVALVWVGWYSFNGGSGLRANGQAISALFVTQIAACTSSMMWGICSYLDDGKVQITHIASGALAGLAGITPGSGFVGHLAGVPYGIIVGICSYYGGKTLKDRLKLDDVLDVTSLQAIPGAVGSILVGFFADSRSLPCDAGDGPAFYGTPCRSEGPQHLDGVLYGGDGKLLQWQVAAVVTQIVWTAFFTYVTLKIIEALNMLVRGEIEQFSLFKVSGLDVPAEFEALGLDRAEHGEKAYDLDFPDDEDSIVMAAELCSEAARGNLVNLRNLIRLGADPNGIDVDGRTPMHLAARGGHIDILEYLVNHCRAQVNKKDNFNVTPIKDAKLAGESDAVAWLRDNGAIDAVDESDAAHLREAASAGQVDQVTALINAGVDINAVDYDGRSALHISASEGHVAVVAVLLKAGASRTCQDRFGSMPIHDAQRYKHKEVEALIRADCEVDFDHLVHSSGRTSVIDHDHGASNRELLAAAQNGDLSDIKRLKTKRANLLGADYDGRTALHIAAKHGHLDIVKYLVHTVEAINVNVQDSQHNTPYTEALKSEHRNVADFLLSKGATELNDTVTGSQLCKAAFNGDLDSIKQAVKEGKSLRSADYDGRTALHLAAATGNINILSYLLENAAEESQINVNTKDRWGGTPLDDAERCGFTEAAKILRRHGASNVIHGQVRLARESELGDVGLIDSSDTPALSSGNPTIQGSDTVATIV